MSGSLLDAIAVVMQPLLLLEMLGGVILGIMFGIIPGLTATLAVVLLIPLTYGMDAISGVAILVGVYIGGISGGLVSAILLGMPGTPSSIATVFDGFPMAKQGRGAKALSMGIFGNLFGTLVSWLFLITLASQLAHLALKFGPFEYVAVIVFGFTTVISLSGDSIPKGVVSCLFGLVVCTIGSDPVIGVTRNTLGLELLESGINAVPAMIGLFVVAEVFRNIASESATIVEDDLKVADKGGITWADVKASGWNLVRSSLIGVAIGMLPGIGGSLANIVAYDQAKKGAKDPETYGTGNVQGVIAPEAANNATIGSALIPMLALGIPGDVVTAALVGGLMLHGLQPGPLLFVDNPDFVYGIYVAFLIGALMMFGVMYLASNSLLPKLLLVPKKYLLPVVLVACSVGCYNLNFSFTDMWMSLVFGFIGFGMATLRFPITPVVISMVLGTTLENQLRLALVSSEGSPIPLFTQPISLLFLVLAVLSVALALRKKKLLAQGSEENG
ncbi:MAG: tripartite tricarboxylate transporter permease [Planctomycetota bacterium]|jgi:putative tricarboxylic transport membrane protein|nr:tripartite tricarboxylate transporter permease [Planctomycetota bacterium]